MRVRCFYHQFIRTTSTKQTVIYGLSCCVTVVCICTFHFHIKIFTVIFFFTSLILSLLCVCGLPHMMIDYYNTREFEQLKNSTVAGKKFLLDKNLRGGIASFILSHFYIAQ